MEIIMSASPNFRIINNTLERNGGVVWNRLHSEREDICEALLKECAPAYEGLAGTQRMSNEDAMRTANWHRELLQSRLRKIDDALDRLMSGSYGNCSKCGRWIEDTKLDFDPAIAFCLDCWQRVQTEH
jgi:RNA polymerase-binding transcription factor DksA